MLLRKTNQIAHVQVQFDFWCVFNLQFIFGLRFLMNYDDCEAATVYNACHHFNQQHLNNIEFVHTTQTKQ